MGIVNYTYNRSTSGGEIITHLINSTDGQGLSFADGALAQLAYAAGGVFGTGDFSVEFIIDQSSANSNNKILYTSGGSNEFQITSETGSTKIELTFDSTDYDLSYDMSEDYGSPVHYVLTFDRSALATLYKDGNSVATVDISGSSAVNLDSSGTAAGYLGGVAGYGVTGVFYRWRTWKKLLSAAEVVACYENASVPIVDQWTNCVTDLDMAFANPERSLQIQSRSGAGDATASVGIFQITPIEQLNTNKLSVGGVTPLVGIGLAAGTTPSAELEISATSPEFKFKDGATGLMTLSHDGSNCSLTAVTGQLSLAATTASKNIELVATRDFVFKLSGGSEVAVIEADTGNVGLGVTPQTQRALTVYDDTPTYVLLQNASTGTGATDGLGIYMSGVNAGLHNFEAGDVRFATTGTDRVIIQSTGGIYEVGGVLKSNLLTNSGFDVWSNSTLEVVSTPFSDTDGSSYASWVGARCTMTDAGSNLLLTYGSGTDQDTKYTLSGLVAGKLYKATIVTANGTNSWLATEWIAALSSASATLGITTGLVAGTHTVVWEASGVDDKLMIQTYMTGAGNLNITSVKVDEVVPGILTAGLALGPDGWKKRYAGGGSANIYREHDGSNTKDGSFYSLKYVSTDTVAYAHALQWPVDSSDPVHLAKFAGRTVTFGCWIKQISTTGSVKIGFEDNSTDYQSSANTATDAWEWMEFTRTLTSTTVFGVKIYVTATGKTVYISQPILSLGSAIGSGNYSRPSGEIVICEGMVRIQNGVSPVAADDKILNLEAMSDGKIPKGCKAIDIAGQLENSVVTTYDGVLWQATSTGVYQVRAYPLVANFGQTFNGLVTCDSNGDIYQLVGEPDATLSGLYQDVIAVHLR